MFQEFKEPVVAPVEKPKSYKQKWLERLRSGEYRQTYKNLNYGDKYCALGLLYVVELHHVVPMSVRNHMLHGRREGNIISMNDVECKTFAEIADWIETNVPDF